MIISENVWISRKTLVFFRKDALYIKNAVRQSWQNFCIWSPEQNWTKISFLKIPSPTYYSAHVKVNFKKTNQFFCAQIPKKKLKDIKIPY